MYTHSEKNNFNKIMSGVVMRYTGAKIILESLQRLGVECIFGYPGGIILDIYEEIYKARGKVKHYLMSSEQGATCAADG